MQALERYEQAHEELDAQALFTVWPSLMSAQRRVFERSFNGYQSMELSIDGCDIAVDGTTAVATCQVIRDVNPKVGRRQNDRRETAFRLRKQDGRWFIDGL